MDTELLQRKFESLGARVRIGNSRSVERVRIDIKQDRKGEYFDLTLRQNERRRVEVLDCDAKGRHLLLMVAPEAGGAKIAAAEKQKFLCGHDERAWFVAAVPESAGASNVRTAMEALKPPAARDSQSRQRVRFKDRNRRKNSGFVRQGEWFFIPRPELRIQQTLILQNERMQRTGGKPHLAEFACRGGGEQVYVEIRGGRVLSEGQYRNLAQRNPAAAQNYTPQRRNASMVVKGRIRHPDNSTLFLGFWHEVVMNTEHQAFAMRSVAFID